MHSWNGSVGPPSPLPGPASLPAALAEPQSLHTSRGFSSPLRCLEKGTHRGATANLACVYVFAVGVEVV